MSENPVLNDLASQFEAQLQAQRALEIAELATADATEITLAGRLLSSVGAALELRLVNGETLRGTVIQASASWLVLKLVQADFLLWYRSLEAISGLQAAPSWPTKIEQTVRATTVLREFASRGGELELVGAKCSLKGYVQRVGHDFVDIIDHGRKVSIPLSALLYVSSPR